MKTLHTIKKEIMNDVPYCKNSKELIKSLEYYHKRVLELKLKREVKRYKTYPYTYRGVNDGS